MTLFSVPRLLVVVPRSLFFVRGFGDQFLRLALVLAGAVFVPAIGLAQESKAKVEEAGTEIFRPEAGKFPPVEKSYGYRGELVFVDHVNRRGSLRVQGAGTYFRNAPHPFAMLPYGIVRYHGAPADLRDLPLGTVVHVRAYLPPDPKISAVPVLPVNNREKTAGYSGIGIAPAENHVLLLEDETSFCLRTGATWKLKELEIRNREGMLIARREAKDGGNQVADEKLTFDAATRIWRGRELLGIDDLLAEGIWPAEGKKSLGDQAVLLGITWKPTPDGIFTRFHVSDIWLNDAAMSRATQNQTEIHRAFIRSRWMPAWVDAVHYGKFGRATVTATLFGGMDAALYADFKKDVPAWINAAENTLKHSGGNYGPGHMASRGTILDVSETTGEPPVGSSGLTIRFETDLIIEGIRPGRVVRIRPGVWPAVNLPARSIWEMATSVTKTASRRPPSSRSIEECRWARGSSFLVHRS